MKLETLTRDSQYLKVRLFTNQVTIYNFQQLKKLDSLEVGFVGRSGPSGHIDDER